MRPGRLLRSSTFRLALVYMGLFGASVLVLLAYIYWFTVAQMTEQADATVEAEVAGLAERYQSEGLAGLTALILERTSRKPAGSAVYLLVDDDLRPVVGNLDRWPAVPEGEDGWLEFRLENAGSPGDVHLARARSFRLRGGFRLLVGRDLHELQATQAQIARTLFGGLAVTLVLALLGGVAMTRSVMRRIEVVNETSRRIMSGELSRRVPTDGSEDEFDELGHTLNAMLDRIEALMEDVRRVSDNIAHDLRTPLARLRNRLELLRLAGASAEDRTAVEQALADADGLLVTFNALLRIARVEAGAHRAAFERVDLGALLRDAVDLYEPLAEERGQDVVVDIAEGLELDGDRELLSQAFSNLLDNAVKYTPAGGRLEVSAGPGAEGGRIVIADSGPGVPAEARERVFQRFFRLDASRSTPGSGLGLSLVEAVARLHGIRVRLEDNSPGLRCVLEVPARAERPGPGS